MTYSPTDVRDALVTTEAREVSPRALGVGLRTHPLRFDNHNASEALPRVAEEFLVASRNTRHDRETQLSVAHYFTDPVTIALAQATRSPIDGAERIQLPASRLPDVSLAQAIAGRRSARDFASAPLPFESLASVLRCGDSETIEVQSRLDSGGEAALRLRTAPSAGGLFPVEIWVAARNITGLKQGIYRYLTDADALETWAGEQELTTVLSSCADVAGDDLAGTCGAMLLFVAAPWRSMRKYGPRGMRFVLHETGSIAQNIHLTATALGLGSLDYSGFFDDETHQALGIDGVYRTVVHMVLLGTRR